MGSIGRTAAGPPLPGVPIHHVVLDRVHARVFVGEVLQGSADVLFVQVADHHRHAGLVKYAGDTQADAARAAGDVRDFVLDVGDLRRLRGAGIRGHWWLRGGGAVGSFRR
jgi:hypothetical protein